MIDKRVDSISTAVSGIEDGAVILSSGFGNAGAPIDLLEALVDIPAEDLTIVSNNAGEGDYGLAALIKTGKVSRIICSYPISAGSVVFQDLYNAGKITLEVVPQGTMSERIRAAGAGIGAFFTPTSAGTKLGEGKETRVIEGVEHVLELPLKGDVALLRAKQADRWGNVIYDKSARNFSPLMAMAATTTIVQVDEIVELGELDPELIVTPGIFVDRVFVHNKSANRKVG
ncbi:MAG: 3-oxoacid CoA-transferase subunit A [Rhodospirillaceae bacterium]|jgi:3-oxoadipate CoA-transferase, alpha subunit|nr:3-oxoacid CoA-transferase subunit A [Rhodospirillaceae bacterium]MBT4938811.1 3-oxoacid CoA-transferase subunit A [Rhodospirillaceae bacterium]MBT5942035.1 3-oxoacid CoA-transferase subunit A [Rhodospirillaceae bacterium]MBT7265252.1 3-oxoacid CoA-transferase subunit A [Rhodospirillaceae bacterium]